MKRLESLERQYRVFLKKSPKGSIVQKIRHNQKYSYLVYRSGGKVKTDYLGKCNRDEVKALIQKISERKNTKSYSKRLSPI